MAQRSRSVVASFTYATAGLIYALRTQRNLRIHFLLALLATLLALSVGASRVELIGLVLTIALVICAELFNTAVETIVDMITRQYHPLARIAKNVAAAGVLVAALTALAVGYLIFFERLTHWTAPASSWLRRLPIHVTFLALVATSVFVVAAKAGQVPWRLQGGMPSWHSAVAFSLATSVWVLNPVHPALNILAALLAVLVAESRWEAGIHSVSEIVTGAVVGILVTLLLYQWVGGTGFAWP
ncbi:MAG: diacylglycerol kinase [Limnochordaceae bacterium]|nr:diacylglycerol kinase [Limnochordaceae bacterium]